MNRLFGSVANFPGTKYVLPGLLVAAILIGLAVRVYVALKPGLWVDEIFSVAMATGHSLEHPAEIAEPALGDYVEADQALPGAAWRSYLQHGSPPASPARVIRAVFLSDTSPPLYYLLLSWWMLVLGTSDASLRLFSVAAAAGSLPLLWIVGRRIGGWWMAAIATVLFAFAPIGVFYSVEGRMYSLTWLFGLALAWASLELHRRGSRPGVLIAWAATGSAALLTHYFLAFVWLGCAAWLMMKPGKSARQAIAAAAAVSLLLVLPWYLRVPESLAGWRVTAGWLDTPLTTREAVEAPLRLAWSLVTPGGEWDPRTWRTWAVLLPLTTALIVSVLTRARWFLTPRRMLPLVLLAAAIFGVIALDLLRGTQAALTHRYVIPGFPAAVLLAGMVLSRLPRVAGAVLILVILAGWAPGVRYFMTRPLHPWHPFHRVAAHLDDRTTGDDLVIVRSIPSGVLAFARYTRSDAPIASWVEQLGALREEDDLDSLTSGVCQVVVFAIHTVSDANTVEPWLHANARLIGEEQVRSVPVRYFRRDPPYGRPPADCPHLSLDPGAASAD